MSRRFAWPGPVLTALTLLAAAALARAQAPPVIGPTTRYAGVAQQLEAFIEVERAQQKIPAVLIVLVDDQETVWARGFGFADSRTNTPATAETVGRVGSVSKLFTDLAVMQLVEQGKLDIDEPVSTYLPDFQPANPHDKPITLRQLMSHRAGLVREPPVGHYFDLNGPSLEETVKSLNGLELVHEPTTRTKYSNAGVAVVGRVVEVVTGKPFAESVKQTVLEPCGMSDSGFVPTDAMRAATARGVMWTTDGRVFDAPPFALGMIPAGDLYATPRDLGRFLAMLFAGGQAGVGRVVEKATLAAMWQPQFVGPETKSGFGLGFVVDDLAGTLRVGHSGAVYGFATDLQALPEEKLGAAVIVTKDCANGTARRIAEEALRLMRAARAGTLDNAPPIELTKAVDPALAKRAAGLYGEPPNSLELIERNGRLYALPARVGALLELRAQGDRLVIDDPITFAPFPEITDEGLKVGDRFLKRIEPPTTAPGPLPERWKRLIGEYGWDHNTLYILEKNGKLHAQIEWFFCYPLEEVAPDVFRFPDFGMYDNQEVVFDRDAKGNARSARAAEVVFPRRPLDGEGGRTFRITPARDVEAARTEAMHAEPPQEKGPFTPARLVDLTTLDPTLKLDIRYASANNFLGAPVYTSARAFLQQPAAAALAQVNQALEPKGYGLLIHDAYRPWAITKLFRLVTPPQFHAFVADPAQGSRHNRGCAVDLTLYDRTTGQPVEMPGGYDEFSTRSDPDYPGGTSLQRWHRDLLRHAMEAEGFSVNDVEWWHFDYKDWPAYPILNTAFPDS